MYIEQRRYNIIYTYMELTWTVDAGRVHNMSFKGVITSKIKHAIKHKNKFCKTCATVAH